MAQGFNQNNLRIIFSLHSTGPKTFTFTMSAISFELQSNKCKKKTQYLDTFELSA